MTIYIIKSGFCMILLFGLYWMLLRNEKLFNFNRYFLIISVVFSLVVPFISIPVYTVNEIQAKEIISVLYNIPVKNQPTAVMNTGTGEEPAPGDLVNRSHALPETAAKRSIGIGQILLISYLIGCSLMIFRFCRNIFIVKRLFRNAEKIDNEWYRIALVNHKINPFSFLRTIYLYRDDYLGELITPNVIRHELEHVRQFHSRDIIFFELVHIFFWFNPALLLYKNAARINHEYLADDAVISNMADNSTYALDLINFVSRRAGIPFTSGFSPSMIRLRLLMINTNTSRRAKKSRILVCLFTSMLLLTGLSVRPEYDEQNRRGKRQVTGNDTIIVEEVFFRDSDFSPLRAVVVYNGKKLDFDDTLSVDPLRIKYINILKGRESVRKYGKNARDGAIEISSFEDKKRKTTDSLLYRQIFAVNNDIPEGKISIPVSNLYSSEIWTYPVFPNQATQKPWRTIGIMTRDFYKIRGKVVHENGEPLPGVFVTATDHPAGTRTDKGGIFLLEDVKPNAMASLTADGYEPLFFRVSGVVYTLDMTITLNKKNGPDNVNNISASYIIRDFTGSWKWNKELSRTSRPEDYGLFYNIHQYDGDSIFISMTSTTPANKEYKQDGSLVFNTVKTHIRNQSKFKISCSIDPDGKSFSVTQEAKSIITSWENKSSENFSLSQDGKRLFIRTLNYPDVKSLNGEEIEVLVFDKI